MKNATIPNARIGTSLEDEERRVTLTTILRSGSRRVRRGVLPRRRCYNPGMGAFITLEGVEGSGKSTQVALLAEHLGTHGRPVLTTREPGGTPLGERLRDVLLDPASVLTPLSELLLLEAARAQLVETVIRPALARGEWVIADRFSDSSVAYQGVARRLGPDLVERLNTIACTGLQPDRTVVLDLPVEDALVRARGRATTDASNSRFEDESLEFHTAVARGFARQAVAEPGRVKVVDARGGTAEVHRRVLAALRDVL